MTLSDLEHSNFVINKAGLEMQEHGAATVRIELGDPSTRASLDFSVNDTFKLMNILGVDFKNGVYVHEALEGKPVILYFDDQQKILFLSDLFGKRVFELADRDSDKTY